MGGTPSTELSVGGEQKPKEVQCILQLPRNNNDKFILKFQNNIEIELSNEIFDGFDMAQHKEKTLKNPIKIKTNIVAKKRLCSLQHRKKAKSKKSHVKATQFKSEEKDSAALCKDQTSPMLNTITKEQKETNASEAKNMPTLSMSEIDDKEEVSISQRKENVENTNEVQAIDSVHTRHVLPKIISQRSSENALQPKRNVRAAL